MHYFIGHLFFSETLKWRLIRSRALKKINTGRLKDKIGEKPKFWKFLSIFLLIFDMTINFNRDFACSICYFFLHLFDKKIIKKNQTERKILKVKFYKKIQ